MEFLRSGVVWWIVIYGIRDFIYVFEVSPFLVSGGLSSEPNGFSLSGSCFYLGLSLFPYGYQGGEV